MIDLAFFIGQKVWIPDANLYGVVQQIILNSDGMQYQIRYWDGSTRKSEWVFSDEIISAEKQKVV